MGLFGGYNEEEFLDPDEIRLRRESAARTKKAHRDCVADHRDDHPGSYMPVNNTRPHNDCKADHTDDLNIAKIVSLITTVTVIIMVIVFITVIASLMIF
ncbi:MAG: hypothetical protein MJ108_04635 [Saccharofermentans sp.]|nr:hypothetical protein [Saccharofermentans sp.]